MVADGRGWQRPAAAQRWPVLLLGIRIATKPSGNEAIRRAKRAGEIPGCLDPEAMEPSGNEVIRRAQRAGGLLRYLGANLAKHASSRVFPMGN